MKCFGIQVKNLDFCNLFDRVMGSVLKKERQYLKQ